MTRVLVKQNSFIRRVGWVIKSILSSGEGGKINGSTASRRCGVGWRLCSVNEPVVVFGQPGYTGELVVSVIVVPVPLDFLIEAFGGADEVEEATVGTITGRSRESEVKGTSMASCLRQDSVEEVEFYELHLRLRVQRYIGTTLPRAVSERGGCSF